MKRATVNGVVGITLLLGTGTLQAEKKAKIEPVLAKAGPVQMEDQFDAPKLGEKWTANKGLWQIQDGAVVGREKKEDEHAAVLTLNQPNRNSVLQFSFKLNGTQGFNLSFNHAKGHLFRVIVNDRGVSVSKDKDKKDSNSKSYTMAKAEAQFASGQWHTMLVEVLGNKVSVQTDNGAKLTASDTSLDVDKTGYRFVVRGGDLVLDEISVWQVAP
jgi:hypothetical protein